MSVYIRCKVESGLVILESDEKLTEPKIVTLTGADTDCRQLDCIRKDGRYTVFRLASGNAVITDFTGKTEEIEL